MFARIARLFRGFLGLFISGLEEANPEALMEAARTEFRQKMTQYNLALAKMAGVAERLKSQVKMKAARAEDLVHRLSPDLELMASRAMPARSLICLPHEGPVESYATWSLGTPACLAIASRMVAVSSTLSARVCTRIWSVPRVVTLTSVRSGRPVSVTTFS